MADKKISQLSSASTPLAGTEVLPIVQSSTTVKVATDDLTVKNVRSNATTGILQIAGPAAAATRVMTVPDANFTSARTDAAQTFTNDQTLGTGNLVIGTAGKGIDFSANTHAAGMTSELLNDYEEGTFTPAVTFGGNAVDVDYAFQIGRYVKVGRAVTLMFGIGLNNKGSSTGSMNITNLPFAAAATTYFHCSGINAFNWASGTLYPVVQISDGATLLNMVQLGTDTGITDADIANGFIIRGVFNYISA